MKAFKYLSLLVIVTLFLFAACKKDGSSRSAVQLNGLDTGKTIAVVKGQNISITLGNPGDGGFTYNAWQYDPAVLKIDSHTRLLPPANSPTGDFGSDNWQFTALNSGTTTLKITASQSAFSTVTMFNETVKVN